jgi:hypothetical protein
VGRRHFSTLADKPRYEKNPARPPHANGRGIMLRRITYKVELRFFGPNRPGSRSSWRDLPGGSSRRLGGLQFTRRLRHLRISTTSETQPSQLSPAAMAMWRAFEIMETDSKSKLSSVLAGGRCASARWRAILRLARSVSSVHGLRVRLHDDRLEVFVGGTHLHTLHRGRARPDGKHDQVVSYHHVMHSPRRKPMALLSLVYRVKLFLAHPTDAPSRRSREASREAGLQDHGRVARSGA